MIEVRAKLKRGPAFFAGETISCHVRFRCVKKDEIQLHGSNTRDYYDVLAWASAQIVCICNINSLKVNHSTQISHSNSSSNFPLTSTSLSPSRGEQGFVVFSTKPKILVCDLTLLEGQYKECTYEEMLPFDLPPSFRGQAVKYSYKLKVGMQRVGSPVKMLHLPLRILTLHALEFPTGQNEDEITHTNPFLVTNPRDSQLDNALQAIQMLSSRRNLSVYKVTNGQGRVVNLSLFKTTYRLGEDIVGTLDFGDAQVSCMQYSVTLQSEEAVAEEKRNMQSTSTTNNSETMIVAHAKHHEVSVGLLQTHISLPVPLHVTPTFTSDLVTLSWRLHFEFVTTIKPITWNGETEWKAPGVVDIETMVWDFPITIYPTAPTHVSKALHVQRDATITL